MEIFPRKLFSSALFLPPMFRVSCYFFFRFVDCRHEMRAKWLLLLLLLCDEKEHTRHLDRVIMSFSMVTKWTKQISAHKWIVRILQLVLSLRIEKKQRVHECDFISRFIFQADFVYNAEKKFFWSKWLHLRLYYFRLFAKKYH